jgi:hypothetical protein
LTPEAADSRPLWLVTESELPRWLSELPADVGNWIRSHAFQAERHRTLAIPGPH